MAGYRSITGAPAPASTARTKLPSRARPTALDFSGWNWVAHTPAALDRGGDRPAVVAGGHHVDRQLRRVRVVEVHPRRARPAPRAAPTVRLGSSTFHCICGCLTPSGSTPDPARAAPRARGPRATPRSPRRASASRCRCRGTAARRSTASSGHLVEAAGPQRLHAPTERRRHRGARSRRRRAISPGSAVRRASAPTCCEGLLRRPQVADAVVEHGDRASRRRRRRSQRALGGRDAVALDG